jgi:hypothetical protein
VGIVNYQGKATNEANRYQRGLDKGILPIDRAKALKSIQSLHYRS